MKKMLVSFCGLLSFLFTLHAQSYLPTTGGTMTGDIIMSTGSKVKSAVYDFNGLVSQPGNSGTWSILGNSSSFSMDFISNGWRFIPPSNSNYLAPVAKIDNGGNAYFAGNVGIGITNPLAKLDVNGNIFVAKNPANAAHGYMHIYNDGYMHIDAAGGAGYLALSGWGGMGFSAVSTIGFSSPYIEIGNVPMAANSSSGILRFHSRDGANADTYFDVNRTGPVGDFVMTTNTNTAIRMSTSAIERFTILGNGNVGIGTSNPQATLDLKGNMITNSNVSGFGENTYFSWDAGGLSRTGFVKKSGQSTKLAYGSASSFAITQSSVDNIGASNDFVDRLVLDQSGNVAIPTGFLKIGSINTAAGVDTKLFVNGNIIAKKIKVTQANWADYVFDSTYTLMPLADVAKFVQANKHLPDVPSAATVEKEGIDIGDTQTLLLKKIEELTLYVLQQQKNMELQNNETKKLKEQIKILELMIKK